MGLISLVDEINFVILAQGLYWAYLQCSAETCEHHEHVPNSFQTRLKRVCIGVPTRSLTRWVNTITVVFYSSQQSNSFTVLFGYRVTTLCSRANLNNFLFHPQEWFLMWMLDFRALRTPKQRTTKENTTLSLLETQLLLARWGMVYSFLSFLHKVYIEPTYCASSETCEHHERVPNSFETRLYWSANAFTSAMSERDHCGAFAELTPKWQLLISINVISSKKWTNPITRKTMSKLVIQPSFRAVGQEPAKWKTFEKTEDKRQMYDSETGVLCGYFQYS